MKIGIPKELHPEEGRVAATPKTATRLQKMGFEILIEAGAGKKAHFSDKEFEDAGVKVLSSAKDVYDQADIIFKVLPPTLDEAGLLRKGQFLASYIFPADNQDLLKKIASTGASVVAMDKIPRISRAQKMDVLSSMANIAGYRAVIEAANHFGRFLNGQMTAAGKVDPAKVLVIGAGVAGLASLGAASSLGAIVRAFDTRKAVAEQIQSMGGEFLTVEIEEDGSTASGYSKEMSQAFIDAEMDLFRKQCREVDIVITTALIPGRPAPKLILKDMVGILKPGSVIVDLAAPAGGNCELTRPGEIYTTDNGVTIVGKLDQCAHQASQLYGNNLAHLIDDMGKAANFKINMEDDVIRGSLIVHDGKVNWPLPEIAVAAAPAPKKEEPKAEAKEEPKKSGWGSAIALIIIALSLMALGHVAPKEFLAHFTVFVLACFVGYQVVWNVHHALHTPLMAVTNAISGIIVLGGLFQLSGPINAPTTILAIAAVFFASINIVGGFKVTHRMLDMFRK